MEYTCKKIARGKYRFKTSKHEYIITNHGYYSPDQCIWWEAVDAKTNCADFHAHTKKDIIYMMLQELNQNP